MSLGTPAYKALLIPFFLIAPALFLLTKPSISQSVDVTTCKDATWKLSSPFGVVKEQRCKTQRGSQQTWATRYLLNERTLLLRYGTVSLEDANENNSLILLGDHPQSDIGCPSQMFLIDLTRATPHIFSFGIKNACSEYHWARWSKTKRSVIALKNNVLFTYSNGKLVPPDDTDGDQIGMPLVYATPMPEAPLTPFVKELILQK